MPYQHTRRGNFFSRRGVDKLFGAERMAEILRFDLSASIGAGDTAMDRFLEGVGLAVLVGGLKFSLHGVHGTLRLKDSFELGDFLFQAAAAAMARRARSSPATLGHDPHTSRAKAADRPTWFSTSSTMRR